LIDVYRFFFFYVVDFARGVLGFQFMTKRSSNEAAGKSDIRRPVSVKSTLGNYHQTELI